MEPKTRIDITIDPDSLGFGGVEEAQLFVDGKLIENKQAEVGAISRHMPRFISAFIPNGDFHAHIIDGGLAKIAAECRFEEIGSSIGMLSLKFRPEWNPFVKRVYIVRNDDNEANSWSLVFSFSIGASEWASPFTVEEYRSAVCEVGLESDKFEEVSMWHGYFEAHDDDGEELEGTFWPLDLKARASNLSNLIQEEIDLQGEKLRDICSNAVKRILKRRKDALVTFFDFPAHIRTSCEQYLTYFVQFLQDLGIEADSEIKQQAGQVMFSISPKDGASALAQVREALDLYLQLPLDSSFSETASQFRDPAVAQLRANIFFLQSQLELARAILQAKNAAIQALDLVVFKQRQLLIATAGQDKSVSKHDEPLIGSTISVTEYEWKGFKLNLPHLLRKLKRTFSLDDDDT